MNFHYNHFSLYLFLIVACIGINLGDKLVDLPTNLKPLVRSDSFLIEFYDHRFDSNKIVKSLEKDCPTQHLNFKNDLSSLNVKFKLRRSFCQLFNGVALQLNGSQTDVQLLVKLNYVKAIWPMVTKKLPNFQLKDGDRANDPYFNHRLTKVVQTHKLGYTGRNVKVAIIDTGVDYTHPYLGSCFGAGCKVAYGRDLVGDDYDGFNEPNPDDDPIDNCNGHGTHVAGILAASGPEFVGVAPNVTLGVYRVFGCHPDARVETDVLIEAMESAYRDGMDIINLSLGGDSNWPQYPDSVVATRLIKLGVVVVAAAGNLGPKGLFEVASPAVADGVISVASFDSDTFITRALQISGKVNSRLDYTIGPTTTALNLTNTSIVSAEKQNSHGCFEHTGLDIKDKLLVVKRGNCTFDLKARYAELGGAAALLIVNDLPGTFTPLLKRSGQSKLPVIGMTALLGNLLVAQITRKPDLRLSTPSYFINANGGRLSTFTAWGPSPTLKLKPELTAPGGLIFSTFPLAKGGYATLSGTSMAAPYLAGTVALYLDRLKLSGTRVGKSQLVNQVRAALQNYAHPLTESDGSLSSVLRQGAGRIDVLASLTGTSRVHPATLLVDGNATLSEVTFEVTNFSTEQTLTYTVQLSRAPTVQILDSLTIATPKLERTLTVPITVIEPNGGIFTLAPNQTQTVKLNIQRIDRREVGFVNGFVHLKTNQTNASALTLPYLITTGKYKELPVIKVKEDSSFPNLSPNLNSTTLTGNSTLNLNVKLYLPTLQLNVEVVKVNSNGTVRSNLDDKELVMGTLQRVHPTYLGRSIQDSDTTESFQVNWSRTYFDSQLRTRKLSSGLYYLKVAAVRPFCTNLKDFSCWQIWRSRVIEVVD